MNQRELRHRVESAVKRLIAHDAELLERNAAERAIGGRLAAHLAPLFPDHHVDVEYDRHGLDPKTVNLPPRCRGGGRKRIVPDVIVHRRGTDDYNLLTMELKKETNREPRTCDRAKIQAMKRELHYQAGVLVELPAGAGAAARQVRIEWL